MICDNCGTEGAKIRKVTRSYGKGDDEYLIHDVPIVSCPSCGESYLTADTLQKLERLKLHRKSFAVEKSIEVVEFI